MSKKRRTYPFQYLVLLSFERRGARLKAYSWYSMRLTLTDPRAKYIWNL